MIDFLEFVGVCVVAPSVVGYKCGLFKENEGGLGESAYWVGWFFWHAIRLVGLVLLRVVVFALCSITPTHRL